MSGSSGDKVIEQLESLTRNELLDENEVNHLCKRLMDEYQTVPNEIETEKIYVVGDLHGQFSDFLSIFELCNDNYKNLKNNYLFLGDYVDRGYFSLEILEFLCILKLRYPNQISLIRGNHEIRSVSMVYGFSDECQKRYGVPSIYSTFLELLDLLPLAALLRVGGKRYFCVHGGISPKIRYIEQLYGYNRNKEILVDDDLSDILWSDPENSLKSEGCGHIFSANACEDFCKRNKVELIIRSHQLAHEGYLIPFENKKCFLIWSVPNYCYSQNNKAKVLLLDKTFPDWLREYTSSDPAGFAERKKKYLIDIPHKNDDEIRIKGIEHFNF